MKILMVASEARPFCKTGGLADVVYSLGKELVVMGQEGFVVLPYYKQIKDKIHANVKKVASYPISMSWRRNQADVYVTYESGITYYFIESSQYFDRDGLYGFEDDNERFAFFVLAVKELLYHLNLIPDIIHVHDWHPGMLPCVMKEDPYSREFFNKTKYVTSIHNPAFQGMMDKYCLGDYYGLSDIVYESGKVRFKGAVSSLKSAIMYSDKITTVSPNHKLELLTPEGSMGLYNVLELREWDFAGILNGIDYVEFNPNNDDKLVANYNVQTFAKGKAANKKALFEQLGIKDYGHPCYSLVSRVTWQKGMDLVFPACEELARRGCNIIMLGSGEYKYEQQMEDLRRRYPDKVAVYIGYNDALAHQIYASSDFFLMPSLFEPCGLGQMIAQRYGTLPIVRRTGGLKDSVINFDSGNADISNGFGFDLYGINDMISTCIYAYDTWWNAPLRKQLIKNAMKTDNSWTKSAKEYLALYKSII